MGKIFLFSGWRQSGKDTSAAYLQKKYGIQRLAFADILKDVVAEKWRIDRTSCDDPKRKELPLLSFPVQPKDKFSQMIAVEMAGEFKNKDGESPYFYDVETEEWYYRGGKLSQEPVYFTPRALCILEGSANRSVNPDYWINCLASKIDPSKNYAISDWRYRSELETLSKQFDVKTIRINRFEKSNSTDSSEVDLNHFIFDFAVDTRSWIKFSLAA